MLICFWPDDRRMTNLCAYLVPKARIWWRLVQTIGYVAILVARPVNYSPISV